MSNSLLLHPAFIVLAQTIQLLPMICSPNCDEVFLVLHMATCSAALHIQLDVTGHPIP